MYLSISKLFEKVAYNQVYSYFTTNELFYEGQYGFREKHSTELANMKLLERVLSAPNDKKLPVSIFMDLSKAFDTLDHKILMNKSKYYGINWTPLCWFMSYLSNRTQYVEINNVISSSSTISTGVPQGSILGPLLFFIYMNDLPCASNLFHSILYADDTTLFSTIEYSIPLQNSNVNDQVNQELLQVYEWLAVNTLSFNINKTKFMVFHPYQKDISQLTLTLNIKNNEIEKVSNFNFLRCDIRWVF